MTYRVIIPDEVVEAISHQVRYLRAEGAPDDRLEHWLERLFEKIDSLSSHPHRFPVARAVSSARGYELRRLNFGAYAVFFRVAEAAKLVEIVALRHGRQRPWEEG